MLILQFRMFYVAGLDRFFPILIHAAERHLGELKIAITEKKTSCLNRPQLSEVCLNRPQLSEVCTDLTELG